jgi:hypothetical protein
MHHPYRDILSRIDSAPLWYDANGTPRYETFRPDLCPNIYAREVVLMRISCQACDLEFDVEVHGGVLYPIENPMKLHYGDPPYHEDCAGSTMNCNDLAVLEVWHRRKTDFGWERVPELEGRIDAN